jgi:hypothetical protein
MVSAMTMEMAGETDPENIISPAQSHVGKGVDKKTIQEDAVFGEIQEGGVNYRDVSHERLHWKTALTLLRSGGRGLQP